MTFYVNAHGAARRPSLMQRLCRFVAMLVGQ